MKNLTKPTNKEDYIFVPGHLHKEFENVTIDWYENFCDYIEGIPNVVLWSPRFADKGFINDEDEVYVHETNLSWFIGSIIEITSQDEVMSNATMLDMNISERINFEMDMEKLLNSHQLVYINRNEEIENNPITEVW